MADAVDTLLSAVCPVISLMEIMAVDTREAISDTCPADLEISSMRT